jgi:uncharacterized protein (DUF4415 family)
MKTAGSKPRKIISEELDAETRAHSRAVAALPDEQFDLTDPDAPEVRDRPGAVRGRFYKPVKKLKSLRIDADVLAFFEAHGPGYQTRINRVLREAILQALQRSGRERV